MDIQINDVTQTRLPEIMQLNEWAVPLVNQISMERLEWLAAQAVYFRVAEIGEKLAGFLIGLPSNLQNDSLYFQWFNRRYTNFIYLDRIVVADLAQHRGVGRALYRDIETFAARHGYLLASEVYSVPRNEISLAFHRQCGYRQVGLQPVENGTKVVTKLLKTPQG